MRRGLWAAALAVVVCGGGAASAQASLLKLPAPLVKPSITDQLLTNVNQTVGQTAYQLAEGLPGLCTGRSVTPEVKSMLCGSANASCNVEHWRTTAPTSSEDDLSCAITGSSFLIMCHVEHADLQGSSSSNASNFDLCGITAAGVQLPVGCLENAQSLTVSSWSRQCALGPLNFIEFQEKNPATGVTTGSLRLNVLGVGLVCTSTTGTYAIPEGCTTG